MAMKCSRCDYVRADDSDAWDCPQCGTTNRKVAEPASKPPHDAPHAGDTTAAAKHVERHAAARVAAPTVSDPRPDAARPAGVTITTTDTTFEAVYRWFSWAHLLLALAVLAVAPLALALLPWLIGVAVTAVLAAAAVYVALVTLVNRSIVRATRDWLWTIHGPVPIIGSDAMDAFGFWPDVENVRVPAPELLWIAKAERAIVDLTSSDGDIRSTRSKVFLKAAFHDRAGVAEAQLLPSTAPDEVEDFIGWQLDGWLLRARLPFYKGAESLTATQDEARSPRNQAGR